MCKPCGCFRFLQFQLQMYILFFKIDKFPLKNILQNPRFTLHAKRVGENSVLSLYFLFYKQFKILNILWVG